MHKMPNTQPIGTVLSKRRQEKGITLAKVAADIHIRTRVLEAFEGTDFDAMPPAGYSRASFSSYARYLGLNVHDVMHAYDQQRADYEARKLGQARADDEWRRRADRGFSTSQPEDRRPSRAGGTQPTQREGRYAARPEASRRASAQPARSASPSHAPGDYDRRASYDSRSVPRGAQTRPASSRPGEVQPSSHRRTASPSAPGASPRPSFEHAAQGGYRGTDRPGVRGQGLGREGAAYARSEWREREQVEALGPDDGYEGGSGGSAGGRNQTRLAGQQGLGEVFQGIVETIKADRRALAVVVTAAVVVVVVVIAVAVSSVVNKPQAVTEQVSVQKTDVTQLKPSGLDLNAIPVNSQVVLTLSADSASAVWAEVNVDGTAVFADNLQAGASNTWTVGKSLTMTLSDLTGVSVTINGTEVTPTISNGTYTLAANVPQDQWIQEPAAQEGQDGAATEDAGTADESGDYSDSYDDSGEYYDSEYSQ